ncbi:hypothetical protein ROZALSC1DRAFT_30259 [Rozella allomycis CSF55]|uniref:Uncharacterized protein n=1 Tax=Rozella allomycis (strain CSF55) TaxID=988480 RepID=A0A075ATJ1_ROZAC|nr:hypothetical protein O9G_000343 [Rozella allomycis CSF55]RKP17997.1 hypothetical protein ROZALSC1DRAFT_30259 [Rozella allomycis CSF55]|eukprot:EPZ33568.1 hypothetical protein O9G_000343 [Rozella allomycis CSF55]
MIFLIPVFVAFFFLPGMQSHLCPDEIENFLNSKNATSYLSTRMIDNYIERGNFYNNEKYIECLHTYLAKCLTIKVAEETIQDYAPRFAEKIVSILIEKGNLEVRPCKEMNADLHNFLELLNDIISPNGIFDDLALRMFSLLSFIDVTCATNYDLNKMFFYDKLAEIFSDSEKMKAVNITKFYKLKDNLAVVSLPLLQSLPFSETFYDIHFSYMRHLDTKNCLSENSKICILHNYEEYTSLFPDCALYLQVFFQSLNPYVDKWPREWLFNYGKNCAAIKKKNILYGNQDKWPLNNINISMFDPKDEFSDLFLFMKILYAMYRDPQIINRFLLFNTSSHEFDVPFILDISNNLTLAVKDELPFRDEIKDPPFIRVIVEAKECLSYLARDKIITIQQQRLLNELMDTHASNYRIPNEWYINVLFFYLFSNYMDDIINSQASGHIHIGPVNAFIKKVIEHSHQWLYQEEDNLEIVLAAWIVSISIGIFSTVYYIARELYERTKRKSTIFVAQQ